MPTEASWTKENEVERLNKKYIREVGTTARLALLNGQAVGLDYQPDNGTRYEMVLTPAWEMVTVGSDWEVPTGFGGDLRDVVVVSIVSMRTSYAIRLFNRGQLHPDYVKEKLGVNWADAVALLALFTVIADDEKVLGVEGFLDTEEAIQDRPILRPGVQPQVCTCGVKTPQREYHDSDCPVFTQGGMTAK